MLHHFDKTDGRRDERLASLARQHTREAENAKKFKGSVAFALQDVNAFLAASNELKNKFSSPIPDFDETLISKEKEVPIDFQRAYFLFFRTL